MLSERIDRLILADGTERVALRLMGVFEIDGGKIVKWRDYYDSAAVPGAAERLNSGGWNALNARRVFRALPGNIAS